MSKTKKKRTFKYVRTKKPARVPAYVRKLVEALEQGLAEVGLKGARVSFYRIPGMKLWRFQVVHPKMSSILNEAQSLVWRIVDGVLPYPERLHVACVWTLDRFEDFS